MPSPSPSWAVTTGQARWSSAVSVVVLALTLALAVGLTFAIDRWARERDRNRFELVSEGLEHRVEDRIDSYLALMDAARGLFVASHRVEPDEFRRFVDELDLRGRYPGIVRLGYSSRERADGRDRYPVRFVEPLDPAAQVPLGYDPSDDPVRREALERARDTGVPAATGPVPIDLVSPEGGPPGVVVYVPIYRDGVTPETTADRRERLEGFVHGAIRMEGLLGDVERAHEPPKVAFELWDLGPPATSVLYRSSSYLEEAPPGGLAHVDVAGRTWVLRTEALPALFAGSSRWLTPYLGALVGLLAVALVLAARFRARTEGQLRLHSLVLESMSEGVTVADDTGTILYTNAAEDAMLGYPAGELLGRSVAVRRVPCDPDEERAVTDEIRGVVEAGGTWSGEFTSLRADGSTFATAARVTALAVGRRRCWICVHADVTERRRAETERLELLARERALRSEAEHASRARDEFLAMVGHELRNPLAPMVTAIELVRRRSPDIPELPVLERQVRHLRRLVDDLLDVARITRGRVVLDRRRHELAQIVDLAVELARPTIEEHHHELEVDVPRSGLAVDADEERVVQVVTNLLVNAAKYTEAGGHVAVSALRDGEEIVLRVRDDGIGMAPELSQRVFELFTQGERGTDRREGGLGIGLAVARRLVELHGGTIAARSEGPGRGSEFEVRLPAATDVRNVAPNVGAVPPPRTPARPLGVLVVDDNRDAAEMLAELLRLEGHDVEVAHDAREALELAAGRRYDVAVLDLGLPEIDGYELARRLPDPRPTLFAVTGYGRDADRARTAAAGFARHFVKPVGIDALLEALAEERAALSG